MKAAIIGGGVIGGGWAARFLLNGWDVAVFDPDPQAERKIGEVLANARAALPALSDVGLPQEGRLTFASSIADAVAGADYIQESVSERLELKHRIYAEVQAAAPDAPLGSSTSGFKPSQLQQGAANAGAIFVAHPFNPVYLLPLVEIVGSPDNDPAEIERVRTILRNLGMQPVLIRKEIDAHVGDRLLEAIWREALWLVHDGIATTEEIDDIIRMSFGLRWAQMGLFETYRIAGGEAGMKHFMEQFGPALSWPWTKLMDVPEFNDKLVDLIAGQSDAQSGHMSIRELERMRDGNLVAFLRTLKDRDWGAGTILNAHDRYLATSAVPEMRDGYFTTEVTVLPAWIDYNGHMTESRYYEANSKVIDAFLAEIGAGLDYVANGNSYYSVETHIRHLGEAKRDDVLTCRLQIVSADEKRFHSFVHIGRGTETVATVEQLCVHVDSKAGKSAPALPPVWQKLRTIAEMHAGLPAPVGVGRSVGQKKG